MNDQVAPDGAPSGFPAGAKEASAGPLRALCLIRDETVLEALLAALRNAGLAVQAGRLESAVELDAARDASAVDLLFVDPAAAGAAACRVLAGRCHGELSPPLFFVAGNMADAMMDDLLRAGATDVVDLSRPARLGPSVRRALAVTAERKRCRQAEQDLAGQRALLQQVVDLVPHHVFAQDREGRYLLANAAVAAACGCTPAALVGRCRHRTHDNRDDGTARRADERGVISCGRLQCTPEEPVTYPDGSVRYLRTTRIPFRPPGAAEDAVLGVAVDVTELKKMREGLLASETRFRDMIACIEDVLYAVDGRTGEFSYLSPAFERLLGYTMDDVVQMGGRAAFLHRTIQGGHMQEQERVFRALQGGEDQEPRQWESWWRCRDGSMKFMEDRWIPSFVGGRLRFTYGVLRDITARRRAEEDRIETHARLNRLGDNIPGGMLYQLLQAPDGAARYTYLSAGIERIFGLPAAEVLANPAAFWALMDDEDRARVEAEQARSCRDLTVFDATFRQRTAAGEWRWIHARSTPRRLPDGSILWDGVALDDTRRRRAEEESSRLAIVVEQTDDSIVITDTEGCILYVNPACERASGYGRAELLGQTSRNFGSGRHDPAQLSDLWSTLARGAVWKGLLVNRRKDGSLYEEDAIVTPVRSESDVITGYAAVKRDVTEKRLLRQQLLHAQKMETIGQLAGGVAHDFNNLLQAILGYVDILLANTADSDPRHADLQQVRHTGQRAAVLTRQLLALGRKQNLDQRVTDLHLFTGELAAMLQRVLGEDIHIAFAFAPQIERVRIDQGQIGQILLNLAVNARDAMPAGGRLEFRTESRLFTAAELAGQEDLRPGRYVCLSVTDTGPGIPAGVIERIFEPFFTTKPAGRGSGLGLATSYGIARQHGGWMDVSSRPGQGACLRLWLPALDNYAEPVELAAPALPSLPRPSRGQGERILFVEDSDVIRDLIVRRLAQQGYAVTPAVDAGAAINEFLRAEGGFDLVITDVVLPDLNGLALLDKLLARNPRLGVLVCSGYTDNDKRWPVILERQWPFIGKPYAFSELLTTVQDLLAARGRQPLCG